MARKKRQTETVTEPTPEGHASLVAEIAAGQPPSPYMGDNGGPPLDDDMREILGGIDANEYAAAIYQGVQDALGEADIYMVGRVLDETVADYLHVMRETEGRRAAWEAAIKFADTILPYAKAPENLVPYKRLLKP